MTDLKQCELWLVTGSQGLYGPEVLEQVNADAAKVAAGLNEAEGLSVSVVCKPVVTTPEGILAVCREANASDACISVVAWMHTFSPAKMWIAGLKELTKPLAHLHTQFHRDLPFDSIDMDYMNLHQSAHGGREFGFICARLRKQRTVIAGHWQRPEVVQQLDAWARAAAGWADGQRGRIARFGDNMRNVAVTEGDKVAAQEVFGYRVDGFGVGDLVAKVDAVSEADLKALLAEYDDSYDIPAEIAAGGARRDELAAAAKIELGLRAFLAEGGFTGFTTCFEELHGMAQLPGLAVQRIMADGFGFGAEGDWKTAALVRAFKVMGAGLFGGASFMEDYTYHLDPAEMTVLGAHMLELCPSIAAGRASLEIHPLSIGNKNDPARLVFNAAAGAGVNATVVDLGDRFRMVVNTVDVVEPTRPLPKLPVARAIWKPRPNLTEAATAWILAGGAHHFAFSAAIGVETVEAYADMAEVEMVLIDESTSIRQLKQELRWNEAAYGK